MLFGALGVIAVLLLAAGLFIRASLRPRPVMDTALAMPPDSYGYLGVSLQADPQLLYAGARAGVRLSGRAEPPLFTLLQSTTSRNGVNLEADVLPWLDRTMGVTVTGVSALREGANIRPTAPQLLWVLSVKDEEAAADGLLSILQARARASGASRIEESRHKGVRVLTVPRSISVAVTERLALIGPSAATVQGSIDRLQGEGASLAANEGYKRALANLPESRTAWLFSPLGPWSQLLNGDPAIEALKTAGLSTDAQVSATLAPMQGGNRVDFYTYASEGGGARPAQAVPKAGERLAAVAPESSYLMLAGRNLGGWWKGLRARLGSRTYLGFPIEDLLRSFEEPAGISLDTEVFGAYTGEYGAIMLVNDSATRRVESAAVLLEAPDAGAARASIEAMRKGLVNNGSAFAPMRISGVEAFVTGPPTGNSVQAGYILGDGYVAGAVSLPVLHQVAGSGPRLADTQTYKEAVRQLEYGRSAMLFADVPGALANLYKDRPADRRRLESTAIGTYIKGLRAVTLGADSGGGESRGSLLLFTGGEATR